MENWKDVIGYEGYYQVSDLGRVRSLDRFFDCLNPLTGEKSISKGKILKSRENVGYMYINLCVHDVRKGHRIHRLVADAFIPNPEGKTQVNHKNGIKIDNRLFNLEWSTPSENGLHAYANGLSDIVNRKKVKCIDNNMIFESSYKAAEWVNNEKYSNTKLIKNIANKIRVVANGQRKIAYDLRWKFID